MLREVIEDALRRLQAKGFVSRILRQNVHDALKMMSIPSRDQIQAYERKVQKLERQMDLLSRQMMKRNASSKKKRR